MGYRRGFGGDPSPWGGGRKCFGFFVLQSGVEFTRDIITSKREGGWIRMGDRCRRVRRVVSSMVFEKHVGALPLYTV